MCINKHYRLSHSINALRVFICSVLMKERKERQKDRKTERQKYRNTEIQKERKKERKKERNKERN